LGLTLGLTLDVVLGVISGVVHECVGMCREVVAQDRCGDIATRSQRGNEFVQNILLFGALGQSRDPQLMFCEILSGQEASKISRPFEPTREPCIPRIFATGTLRSGECSCERS
jgi:hypothetical protein